MPSVEKHLDDVAGGMPAGNHSIIMTTSGGLVELARDAAIRDSNRQANMESLKLLDPDGIHIVAMHMIHNDNEMRLWWMIATVGKKEPDNLWLDVSFEAFEKYTRTVSVPAPSGQEPADA